MIGLLTRVLEEQRSTEEPDRAVDPDPYTGDDVVTAFVERLRRDEVTPGQRATIREELGIETPESVQVRLEHVQSEVADLSAYADALSAFLDEEGRPSARLDEIESELDRTNDRLDDIERRLDEAQRERSVLASRLDELRAENER
jgi:DNA repair exonuclease SbcCD ATPase subunit